MACVSVPALLCGNTQIPLIPHLSDHHRAENAKHRRAGNGMPGLSERERTTSKQCGQKRNLGTMKIRCDSSPNSIAAASRPCRAAMQQQQHSATETAGQGGVILFRVKFHAAIPNMAGMTGGKMGKKLLIALMALTAHIPASIAGMFESGNTFLANPESVQIPYVLGIIDGVTALTGMKQANASAAICLPKHATAGQVTAVAKKFLNEHPEELHLSASSLIIFSLRQAFPCK